MFLHFHKLTTELFNLIKTQQINVFNASVDSNANCLCHTLWAIKSAGLQSAILLSRGLCVAGQWFLWLRQLMKLFRGTRHCTCLPVLPGFLKLACQWMSMLILKMGQGRLLTDFCGGYCDVVPHVSLPVQRFGQRDRPIVHVDVELPLQVCVPIDEVSAKTTGHQKLEQKLLRDCTTEAYFAILWVLWLTDTYPSRETCRLMHIKNSRKSIIIIWGIITAFTWAAGGIKA